MSCIAGIDGYFKRLNPPFSATLGYSMDEMPGRPFVDFIHPDDIAPRLAEMAKLGEGEPTASFDNRYRAKDGSWKWLSWKAHPFPVEGLIYPTAHDITKRKAAEEAFAAAAQEAERAYRAKN